jgi:tyrosyl-tRNA synthetase
MSKSKNNYVALSGTPSDVFGKLMSAADRLLPDYLRGLTELLDAEIEILTKGMRDRRVNPMAVKTLLAADVTATIHGARAATEARRSFRAQFSERRFSDAPGVIPVSLADHGEQSVAAAFVTITDSVPSMRQVRRIAADGGLRLVIEQEASPQRTIVLTAPDADRPLTALLAERAASPADNPDARFFLRCGRRLIEVV